MFFCIEFILENLYTILGQVFTGSSFPMPLKANEEKLHIDNFFYNKDENACKKLVEHNLRLVAHIVKKYGNTGLDVDDLISIGTIGLIKGIKTFNPEKNTRLATYCARCIENEILMTLRSAKKERGEISLQEPIGTDQEGNEITMIDILGTDADEIPNIVDLKIKTGILYNKIAKCLNDRERMVIEMRYGLLNGKKRTQREIATMLGISRSYVSRIEKKAVIELSKVFFCK